MTNETYRIKVIPLEGAVDELELSRGEYNRRTLENISGVVCLVEEQTEGVSLQDERITSMKKRIYNALETLKDTRANAYINFGGQQNE